MNPRGLIDTGSLLALLDTDDRWHDRCKETLRSIPLPLATSAAVLADRIEGKRKFRIVPSH